MNTTDLFIIGAFIALLFFESSRFAATIILIFNAIYFNFIINAEWDYYYLYSAALDTSIGVILYGRYRAVAILSFSLIIINYVGYLLSINYHDPYIYDNIYLTIILLQVLVLLSRGLSDGFSWGNKRNPLVFLADFDSRKNHAKIQKTT